MEDELEDEDEGGEDLLAGKRSGVCVSVLVWTSLFSARLELFFIAIAKAHFNIRTNQPNDYINSWIKIALLTSSHLPNSSTEPSNLGKDQTL